jgi:hypothetical protein
MKHTGDALLEKLQSTNNKLHAPSGYFTHIVRSDSISGSHGHFSEPSGVGISSISYVCRECHDTEVHALSSVVQAPRTVNKILTNLIGLTTALGESNSGYKI